MVHKVLSKQEGNEREVKFSQCLAQNEDPEDAYAFTRTLIVYSLKSVLNF